MGMVYMHVSPTGWLAPGGFADKPAALAWVEGLLSGRAMSLFVLLAGISVALMSGGARPATGAALDAARRRLALRAGALLVISLVVDQLSGMSLSILIYYALWMLLLLPLLPLRPRALLTAAAVSGVVLPVFSFVVLNFGRDWAISPFNAAPSSVYGLQLLLRPAQWLPTLGELFVGGGFQTPYAVPLLLAGLALGRLDLRSAHVRSWLAIAGSGLVVAAWLVSRLALGPLGAADALAQMMSGSGQLVQPWTSLLTLPPHQLYALSLPMAPFMTGVGLLLVTGCLWLTERPFWRVACAPLAASGRLALTWYAAHLVFIERVMGEPPYAFTWFAAMAAFALAFSPLWLRRFQRGPLEALMHRATLIGKPSARRLARGGTAVREASD